MKLMEIVQAAMLEDKESFNGLDAARVTKIASSVLHIITNNIDNLDDGKLAISGSVNFTVKQVTREKDGVKSIKKRVLFRSRAQK